MLYVPGKVSLEQKIRLKIRKDKEKSDQGSGKREIRKIWMGRERHRSKGKKKKRWTEE